MATNCVTRIAEREGRDYITPEDVTEAFREGASPEAVRLAVLEAIGAATTFAAEDLRLCAFVAFKGNTQRGEGDGHAGERA